MTTIILTVLSIMVAAAAALILVFWGGDMYQDGSVAARADTFMNAGQNVAAAADQFRMANRVDPAGMESLTEGGFLRQYPYASTTTLVEDGPLMKVVITGVDREACIKINETQGREGDDPVGAIGCDVGSGTYHMTA